MRSGVDRNDKGATLVETAIITPILILIVIGILELGLAFKDFLTASYLSREGARIGAMAGDDILADCTILTGLADLMTADDLNKLVYIEIYQADQFTGAQGATNRAVYNKPRDPSVCNVPAGPSDGWTITPIGSGWPPDSRNTTVGTNPLDIIGVRIVMTHDWITNLGPFGGSITIDEATITRMEPEAFE